MSLLISDCNHLKGDNQGFSLRLAIFRATKGFVSQYYLTFKVSILVIDLNRTLYFVTIVVCQMGGFLIQKLNILELSKTFYPSTKQLANSRFMNYKGWV